MGKNGKGKENAVATIERYYSREQLEDLVGNAGGEVTCWTVLRSGSRKSPGIAHVKLRNSSSNATEIIRATQRRGTDQFVFNSSLQTAAEKLRLKL